MRLVLLLFGFSFRVLTSLLQKPEVEALERIAESLDSLLQLRHKRSGSVSMTQEDSFAVSARATPLSGLTFQGLGPILPATPTPPMASSSSFLSPLPLSSPATSAHHGTIPLAPSSPITDLDTIRELELADGTVLRIPISAIPDPPAASFANNIPRLNRMWDDHSKFWDRDSVVEISGHPIALVHLPKLYKHGKPGQWKGLKSRWGDWRVRYVRYDSSIVLIFVYVT